MIEKKYQGIVMSCLAAVFISVPISLAMTLINAGFVEGFLLLFAKSALVSIVISVPLANIGVPIAEKLAKKIASK